MHTFRANKSELVMARSQVRSLIAHKAKASICMREHGGAHARENHSKATRCAVANDHGWHYTPLQVLKQPRKRGDIAQEVAALEPRSRGIATKAEVIRRSDATYDEQRCVRPLTHAFKSVHSQRDGHLCMMHGRACAVGQRAV